MLDILVVQGNSRNNYLRGYDGHDWMNGRGGKDVLNGAAGNVAEQYWVSRTVLGQAKGLFDKTGSLHCM